MEERPTASGWAIASLITSLLCLSPFALITGIVALVSIGRSAGRKTGKGFAWAGIVISVITMLAAAAVVVLAAMGVVALSGMVEEQRPVLLMRNLVDAENTIRASDWDENGAHDYWVADVAGVRTYSNRVSDDVVADNWYGWRLTMMTTDQAGKPYAQDSDGDGKATTNLDRFGICLYAVDYARKPLKSYIVNEEGVVWMKDTGGQPVLTWPRDPAAEGWTEAVKPSSSSGHSDWDD